MRPLRLAVFGWVKNGAGSVASAHFQLCRGLLDHGHSIDLYGAPSFIPDPGYLSDRFTYVPVEEGGPRGHVRDRLPREARAVLELLPWMSNVERYRNRALAAVRERHRIVRYDAVLFLGVRPGRPIAGIPNVVWPQGAPQNELHATRALAGPITRIAGRGAYLKVRLYYELKDRLVWRWARRDHLILASRGAREEAIRFGVAADRVCVVPYPLDLDLFTPGGNPVGAQRRVLCIGRLDPRKRIDLLVDAVRLLATRRDDFRVEIIGRDGYLSGWRTLVETAARELPIAYTEAVPQVEIVKRLRSADLLVQPSEREEFGSAVAEALACGVPAVTGPTNWTGEYVPDGGSLRFDRYTPESLGGAIERGLTLARDPSTRARCRAAAQAFAADSVAGTVSDFIARTLT